VKVGFLFTKKGGGRIPKIKLHADKPLCPRSLSDKVNLKRKEVIER
jgi:hypothetical protein